MRVEAYIKFNEHDNDWLRANRLQEELKALPEGETKRRAEIVELLERMENSPMERVDLP